MAKYLVKMHAKAQTEGSFSARQLKALAQQGQLQPSCLVSEDGVSWHEARKYKGLFTSPANTSQPPRPHESFMTAMATIPKDLRWDLAVAGVREMIRYRRSEPLSKDVINVDPTGTLVLTRDSYDQVKLGMSPDQAISIVGSDPYRDEYSGCLRWCTMGGSWIHVTISRGEQKVVAKSFHNIIARQCRVEPSFEEFNELTAKSKGKQSAWPAISTVQIAKYFLKHSNRVQRRWFQSAMSGAVQFKIQKIADRDSIQFVFDRDEPDLWDFYLETGGPAANTLTDRQIEQYWQMVLKLGSEEALFVRNRLMDAVNQCNNFCTPKSRKALLAAVQQGDCLAAEQLKEEILVKHRQDYVSDIAQKVANREEEGPIYGRDYAREEEGPLWHWYSVIIHERDDYRCQYCGVGNDEHADPEYHVDHVFPVSRGGKTELSNLQLLCKSCNLTKSAKLESEYPDATQAGWYKNR